MQQSGAVEQRMAPAMRIPIIDCDVHPLVPDGVTSILPYLSLPWKRRLEGRQVGLSNPLPPQRYSHPNNILRTESTPPSGGAAGSAPMFAPTDYLDRNATHRPRLNPIHPAPANPLAPAATPAAPLP